MQWKEIKNLQIEKKTKWTETEKKIFLRWKCIARQKIVYNNKYGEHADNIRKIKSADWLNLCDLMKIRHSVSK